MSPRRDRSRARRSSTRGRARRPRPARRPSRDCCKLAEERDSGQIPRIARFLAATYNGQAFPFDLFELRAVDIAISDDMLCCLDALRWGRADLHTLIPDGDARVRAVIERWGLRWPEGA